MKRSLLLDGTLRLLFIAGSFLLPHSASAWKVDAHVWVAAEVLKEATKGNVVILRNNDKFEIRLPDHFAKALREHPRLFLLGSLGPDAFPDVMGGQLVIHPSYPGGWGTADWLRHLLDTPGLTSSETAFILGFLSHAASDTFAHTFVNRYAGDVFEAFDHPTAATRHIYIEGLVSNYLPKIQVKGIGGAQFAADLLRVNGKIDFPERLIQTRMLLDGAAANQFGKGGASHLSLAYGLHRDLGTLLEEGGALEQLQVRIADFIIELYAEAPVDDRVAEELTKLANGLSDSLNDAAADLKPILDKLNQDLTEIEGFPDKLAEESLKAAVDLIATVADLKRQLDSTKSEVGALELRVQQIVASGLDEVVVSICDGIPDVFKPSICYIRKASDLIIAARNELKDAVDKHTRSETDFLANRKKLKEAISSGMATLRQRHELNRLARAAVIALANDKPFGDGLRTHFQRWRDSIPVALVEFTRSNAATIINSVDPAVIKSYDPDRAKLMDPLKKWVICYGPTFLSVPSALGDQVCAGIEGVGTLKEKINEFENKLGEVLPPLGDALRLKTEILTRIEQLKAEVLDEAMLKGFEAFDSVAHAQTARFYDALATEITPEKVDREMTRDDSGQNLPIIHEAARRILTELNINAKGVLDSRFPPLYNSIVLSKLALLDASGLQRLSELAGVTQSSLYKNGLYGDGSPESKNVLLGFLRSIDGNHQWQEVGPPHPRSIAPGFDENDYRQRKNDPENYSYGYRDVTCTRTRGMRFWVDPLARSHLFKAIFKGKLSTGIDDPTSLVPPFPSVLYPDYPPLYDSGDGWMRDSSEAGPDLEPGMVAHITGIGPASRKLEFIVPGQNRLPLEIGSSGRLDAIVTIPKHRLPARVQLTESGRNGLLYAFDLGCDGTSIPSNVDLIPTVIVEKGDTLWRIAQRIVGDGRRYTELLEINAGGISDPDLIHPGQTINSPWGMPFAVKLEADAQPIALSSSP